VLKLISAHPGETTIHPKTRSGVSGVLSISPNDADQKLTEAPKTNDDLPPVGELLGLIVDQDPLFRNAGLCGRAVAIIEDVIFLAPTLGGEGGLPYTRVNSFVTDVCPTVPHFVWSTFNKIGPDPNKNKRKMFVAEWEAPMIDKSNDLTFGLVEHWWHLKYALDECRTQLHSEISARQIDLNSLSGALAFAVTIETTQDNRLILCQRGNTDENAGDWSIGIGELMDPQDGGASVYTVVPTMHPINGILRGMGEELGLRDELELLKAAEVTFLGLGRSVNNFNYNLFCHARLNTSVNKIKSCWTTSREAEVTDVLDVSFGFDDCIDLIVSGVYLAKTQRKSVKIVSWSRAALLATCIHKFRRERVQSKLASLVDVPRERVTTIT